VKFNFFLKGRQQQDGTDYLFLSLQRVLLSLQCFLFLMEHLQKHTLYLLLTHRFFQKISSLTQCWSLSVSCRECVVSNPRYLVTTSDSPTVLHEGSRSNALHMAAKLGRTESAKLVLELIEGNATSPLLFQFYVYFFPNIQKLPDFSEVVVSRQCPFSNLFHFSIVTNLL
jgi:hypothetical protein